MALYLSEIPGQKLPTPYKIKYQVVNGLGQAENADVLIVGDQVGKNLSRFLPELQEKLKPQLNRPLKIFNWATNGEGLHRTIYKLSQLKKFPDILIYLGGSQEFYERKINLDYKKQILKDFQTIKDENIYSLILSFPFLSKIYYSNYPKIQLTEQFSSPPTFKNDNEIIQYMDLSYKVFEQEFLYFLSMIRQKRSKFFVITPPLNIERRPGKVCNQTTSKKIKKTNSLIESIMDKKLYKVAIEKLKILGSKVLSNAQTYYLLGQSLKNIGLTRDAKVILYKAQMYDCSLDSGRIAFNKIQIVESEKFGIEVIDFNRIVNNNLGKNILFFDDYQPQDIYFQELVLLLSKKLERHYSIE